METFVDREVALKYIDDALEILLDKKRLLRTPMIDFYGTGGIGKTFFLKNVQQRCLQKQLYCIWVDVNQDASHISREVVRQVQSYGVGQTFETSAIHPLHVSISTIRTLLTHGPVVVLFNAIDTNNKEQMTWLENMLYNLSDDSNLFAVLTSKRALLFENNRLLARRLTLLPLQPFDLSVCKTYLDATGHQIEPEIYARIFIWTRGYPLALSVMTQAVVNGLDPRKDQDQKEIITHLTDRVLHQNLLGRVNPTERNRYQTLLMLLSVPRHFNLILMQELIEHFTPQLKRENSLAYFGLPREINQTTEVLNWNSTGTGFSVDKPIRAIYLLKFKIEQPELYDDVHSFVAQMNRQWVTGVTGADRIRYLCEYLYHKISNRDTTMLALLLAAVVQEIAGVFPESVAQFADGVIQDEELKEILGTHLSSIEALMQEG